MSPVLVAAIVYAVGAVISLLVAALIQGMVVVVRRNGRVATEPQA